MNSELWFPPIAIAATAALIDIRSRRIPNWLTLPGIAAGVLANVVLGGWIGAVRSAGGVLLAILLLGVLCGLRTMGFGDLKLCAAVGAWIGASDLLFTLLITAMAGGVIALIYAVFKDKFGQVLDSTGSLIIGTRSQSNGAAIVPSLDHPNALAIPYAPAIAIGVAFSYFAS